jgi:predicted nucleic acid-binding protein
MLAWIQEEPAAPAVRALLSRADSGRLLLRMSWYNAAETFYILTKRKGDRVAEAFLQRLPSLPVGMVLPDENGILAAARIKAAHPVAFGDAFAIALALEHKASVVTGDPEIRKCAAAPVHWLGA